MPSRSPWLLLPRREVGENGTKAVRADTRTKLWVVRYEGELEVVGVKGGLRFDFFFFFFYGILAVKRGKLFS